MIQIYLGEILEKRINDLIGSNKKSLEHYNFYKTLTNGLKGIVFQSLRGGKEENDTINIHRYKMGRKGSFRKKTRGLFEQK